MKKLFALAVLVAAAFAAYAQKLDLTIDNIMRGPGLVGYEPEEVRWTPDFQKAYVQTVGARSVSSGNSNCFGGREIAHGCKIQHVSQHSARDDSCATRRIRSKRQAMKLILLDHPFDEARRGAVVVGRTDLECKIGIVDNCVDILVAHRYWAAAHVRCDVG